MNPRVTVGTVGAITLLLGLGGLLQPQSVMNLIGYAVAPTTSETFVRGEVRALYGGLMVVAGVFTLLSVADPRANQGRLLMLGLLWLGACGGRVFGIFVDGNPGLFGWLSVVVELVLGGALVISSQSGEPAAASPSA
jgi:drug/metabolite transporter superfamily protein YnfA